VPEVHRVLVPTDLSPRSNVAILHALGLLRGTGGDLHVLHVADPEGARIYATDAEVTKALLDAIPDGARLPGVTVHTEVVRRSDVARAIVAAAARVDADVVCLSSHGRSGVGRTLFGSVAESVMREDTRPVLVVRGRPE